jgi:hypothetical protein
MSSPIEPASTIKVNHESDFGFLPLTPPSSGKKQQGTAIPNCCSPNIKEISENSGIDTPEKTILIKDRAKKVLDRVNGICSEQRENLAAVLGNMCAFDDPESKAIMNDVVEMVVVKRGVKRTVKELLGDDTMTQYIQSIRVPDWALLYFKTKARISGDMSQTVINVSQLGRTGVRLE